MFCELSPLYADWGNDYFMGELVVREGCLRVVGDEDINDPRPAPSFLLVWPEGFTLVEVEDGSTVIEDTTGAIVARVGNDVRFSGWRARSESGFGGGLARSLPDECVGPYFVVGDDVTVVGPDEPETVSIPGSTLFFPRRKTLRSVWVRETPAVGYSEPMELFVENDCMTYWYNSIIS